MMCDPACYTHPVADDVTAVTAVTGRGYPVPCEIERRRDRVDLTYSIVQRTLPAWTHKKYLVLLYVVHK